MCISCRGLACHAAPVLLLPVYTAVYALTPSKPLSLDTVLQATEPVPRLADWAHS